MTDEPWRRPETRPVGWYWWHRRDEDEFRQWGRDGLWSRLRRIVDSDWTRAGFVLLGLVTPPAKVAAKDAEIKRLRTRLAEMEALLREALPYLPRTHTARSAGELAGKHAESLAGRIEAARQGGAT